MNRFAAAAAIMLAVGGLSVFLLSNRAGGGPGALPSSSSTATVAPSSSPSAPPTASPSLAPLDTSTWVEYASPRYGFTISHPADWAENPATRSWTFENDVDTTRNLESTEHFNNPAGSVGASVWSVEVARGTTLVSWIESYCVGTNGAACSGIAARGVPVQTADQRSGLGFFGPEVDTIAFFLRGDRMYVAAVWRVETDPAVASYGGAWRLLRSFVSTMTLEAPASSPSPSS